MSQPVQFQGMPPANTPVLNPDGTMNIAWYRLLQSLYDRSGLGTSEIGIRSTPLVANGLPYLLPVFLASDPNAVGTPRVAMFDQVTGALIGIFGYTP